MRGCIEIIFLGLDPITCNGLVIKIMQKDIRIIFDPVSERVYASRKDMEREGHMTPLVDVTEDFYNVLFSFFPSGSIRAFGSGNPAAGDYEENLLICARNDPKSLLKAIGAIREHMEGNFTQKQIGIAKKELMDKKDTIDGKDL